MKRIKEIKIKNFKAFQEEESFLLNGKNVLIYGNNGSGKSSFFWALYTLLQSSIKQDRDVKKYFKNYLVSDINTHQTLKNIFMDQSEDSYIQLTSIDTVTNLEKKFTISHNTVNTNDDSDTLIQELNLASDFINYKLLHNFYQASHKQEVNLWSVFERDIFPFLTEGTENWLEDIIKPLTGDVPRTPTGNVVSQNRKDRYVQKVNELNNKIHELLNQITENANEFIKEHFFDNKDVIRISLLFEERFSFDNIRQKMWEPNKDGIRHDTLKIKLKVEIYDESLTPSAWRIVERVQSFLNEAQLTRIAIGVRIGALRTRPIRNAKFKILVLDDMLISLDLSNRMDVTKIIMNTDNKDSLSFFDDYQKIILTHDKGFYNLIQRNTNEEDWVYYNFSKDESKNTPPKVEESLTSLQKASKYFEEGELENCGNELRKEAEAILASFLDPYMKKVDSEFSTLSKKINKAFQLVSENKLQQFKSTFLSEIELNNLKKIKEDYHSTVSDDDLKMNLDRLKDRLFDFLIDFNEKGNRKEKLLNDTKEVLDRVMNAASHHTENPLYSSELKDAIEKINNLKNHLNEEEVSS